MDFLKKVAESAVPKGGETADKSAPAAGEESQSSDLFSSAKLVADAARSTIQKETPKYDNAEVAGAAADLLDAAQTYGKLDQTTGVGSYIEKAENYLHEYEASNTTKPKTEEAAADSTPKEPPAAEEKPTSEEKEPPATEPAADEPKDAPAEEEKPSVEEPKAPSEAPKEEETEPADSAAKAAPEEPSSDEKAPSDSIPSGVGEYAKIAEGFLNKGSEDSEAAAGKSDEIGEYVKVAEGFLNKKSEGTEGDSDQSGIAGVAKLAGGFFK